MTSLNELSIIIVTWNGDDLLQDCLASLARTYGTSPEIIVVDNANQPSTKCIASEYENVVYLATESNLGFAGGNNVGLKAASRPYVLLLNNDTVIHEDSFSPLIAFLKEHGKVGIVQGTMNVPALDNGLDDCGILMTPFGIQRHLHRGEPTATTQLKPRKVFAAKGAMLMFKKAILDDLGFLFHDHFWSYYEETDFCHRARNAGWETWFVPTPPIDHLCGRTSSKFDNAAIWRRYFRNIVYSFWHNFGLFGRAFTLPSFICAAFIRSPSAMFEALRDLLHGK